MPIDAVLVRRPAEDLRSLRTVASSTCADGENVELLASRSELGLEESVALREWLAAGRASRLSTEHRSRLSRALLPAGLEGSVIAGPLSVEGKPVGIVLLHARRIGRFADREVEKAQGLLEPLSAAFENDQRLHELSRMRESLEADRRALLSRLERQDISETVVGESSGLRAVMHRVEQVAPTDAPVLILGETGSGKEVIARAIHARSRRAGGPVVRVNCGAIPPELVDSELFGHEKGSFTGAVSARKGWFERADGGTLFLDEIGELPPAAQVRLLRVLQDGSLERVGAHHSITVDVRIVAATHRNLETMVAEGRFREDLWYRISVFPMRLPALRERPQDIAPLAAHFAQRAGLRLGGTALAPSASDIGLLMHYSWPGNVRELAAVIERAAILGNGKRLEIGKALGAGIEPTGKSVPPPPRANAGAVAVDPSMPRRPVPVAPICTLDEAMKEHIERALAATKGRIEGRSGAARLLGINPHTLRARMRKLEIDWSQYRDDLPDLTDGR
ncbi:MAG: sigma 54-interacting transcriptional regulator [Polyangiaceae bacterium]|nr:sigma 54-interacting transcriptional regulator [Polyangiaceae bacterium]